MMRIKHLFLIATFFTCLGSSSLVALEEPGAKSGIRLDVDTAQFFADSSHSVLEIYQSVGRDGLTYNADDDIFVARYRLTTTVIEGDSIVFNNELMEADSVVDQTQIKPGQQFVHLVPLKLNPGRYRVITLLEDQNSDEHARRAVSVEVQRFAPDSVCFSEIQFATKISRAAEATSVFVKNNLLIMPNPRAVFGDGMESMTFYAELYSLPFSHANASDHYRVDYLIEDENGKVLHRLPGKERSIRMQSAAIYTSFDISALSSGAYKLRLDARDEAGNFHVSQTKPFSVFREAEAAALYAEQERKVYDSLDEKALQLYFDQISYIAENNEKGIFPSLTLEGKRNFIVDFWRQRDPTPGTPRNEFKEDFIQRLMKARIHFSAGNTPGWKTDRGRILLTYGAPDFIDRDSGSPDKKPYEVWRYEKLRGGGVEFIFVDINQNSSFFLVHSTYPNEISNTDWESYLQK